MTRKPKDPPKEPQPAAEGPLAKIAVAVVIALLVGGSSPWWWTAIHPNPSPVPVAECSQEALRSQLRFAGPDKSAVIEASARIMQERLRLQDLDCVYGLAAVLLQEDQANGHGLYYSGEVWRVRAKLDSTKAKYSFGRMREHFFRYLSTEPDLDVAERDGKAAVCYRRAKGYCAERTAWISHVMAIDYYLQALETEDMDTRMGCLRRAAQFLEKDLQFGGFDQIIESVVLKRKIFEGLKKSDAQPALPADGPRPPGSVRG